MLSAFNEIVPIGIISHSFNDIDLFLPLSSKQICKVSLNIPSSSAQNPIFTRYPFSSEDDKSKIVLSVQTTSSFSILKNLKSDCDVVSI